MSKGTLLVLFFLFPYLSGCSEDDNKDEGVKVESISMSYSGELYDIYFTDQDHGFIIGEFDFGLSRKSIILKTNDGGRTWQQDSLNLVNRKAEGISGFKDRLFISVTDLSLDTANPHQVYYSDDRRETWNHYWNFRSLPFFISETEGLVAEGTSVYKTENGQDWVPVLTLDYMVVPYLVWAGENTFYLTGGSSFDATDGGFLFKSSDKGENWDDLGIKSSNITYAQFISADVGFLFTFDRKMWKTTNGGTSFTALNTSIAYSNPACHFFSEQEGIYTTSNSIFYTNDGGVHWEGIHEETTNDLKNKIFFIDDLGFCIGNNGLLLRITKQ